MRFSIGLSFGYHDSSVAIAKNNELVGIYQEERFSRVKHDARFPINAITYALEHHQISVTNLDFVAYYEDPILKFNRLAKQFNNDSYLASYLYNKNSPTEYLSPVKLISDHFCISPQNVVCVSHHDAHAYSALSMRHDKIKSRLTILTVDGVGEFDTAAVFKFDFSNNAILTSKKPIASFPNSIGLFYSAITSFLGFDVNDAEYKVMGLAAYGRDTFSAEMSQLIYFDEHGLLKINNDYLQFSPSSQYPYKPEIFKLLGLPAPRSKQYAEEFTDIATVQSSPDLARYANIACSAQNVITKLLTALFSRYAPQEENEVGFSGGVALNTKANYSLLNNKYKLIIPPDPGDGGSSLGALVGAYLDKYGSVIRLTTPYVGFDLANDDDIEALPDNTSLKVFPNLIDTIQAAATLLASGKVIGWVQGRSEFGPRALGNRSILANPGDFNMQSHVNRAVKFREPFRPFAPVILEECLGELFDTTGIDLLYENHPLKFMLTTLPAKDKAYELIPACIHVDGTSRVQIVNQTSNCVLYQLISNFYGLTGIPGLLNTSFNLRGEPMVNNAYDALQTFIKSQMEHLFIGKNFYTKK
jgi:carbamoyltransferase